MRPIPGAVAALTLAVALAACSGGRADDIARLEADLDTQARAQTTLRERVIELEDQLAAATDGTDAEAATAELSGRIDELQGRIDELVRQLEEATTAREDETAEILASLASLEGSLAELRSQLQDLETEQVRLQEDLGLLERRFENHGH